MKRWDLALQTILDVIDSDPTLDAIIGNHIKPDEDNDEIRFPSITYSTVFNPHFNENESELFLTLNIWAINKEQVSDIEWRLFQLFDGEREYQFYDNTLYMFCDVTPSRDIADPQPNVARRVAEYRFVIAKY